MERAASLGKIPRQDWERSLGKLGITSTKSIQFASSSLRLRVDVSTDPDVAKAHRDEFDHRFKSKGCKL
jgi:hypothetical protein